MSSRSFPLYEDDTVMDRSRLSEGTTVAVFGGSASGKTTLIVKSLNAVVNDFDVIVVFTLSVQAKPLGELHRKIIVCTGFQPAIVKLANQINLRTGLRYRILFVLDDVPNLHKDKMLEKMVLIYRNSGISTLYTSQHFRGVPPALRSSFHRVAVTGARTAESRETLYQLYLRTYLSQYKKEVRDSFIHKNTTLNPKKGDKPRYLIIDNIQDELMVGVRP